MGAAFRTNLWKSVFPPGVEVRHLDESGPVPEMLHPEELAVANAGAKRRGQYARGRACARAALAQLGCQVVALPAMPDRLPRWPRGTVGSITHCDGLVAAAVARESAFRSVGIDAEPTAALGRAVATRVMAPEDWIDPPKRCGVDPGILPRLVFSAKEVVHKCVNPLTGRSLGFQDVAIALDFFGGRRAGEGRFMVQARSERAEEVLELTKIMGGFSVRGDFISTGGVIR